MLRARAEIDPQAPALWWLQDDPRWQVIRWRQFLEAVATAARGLRALGLRHGERVGLIASSSPQWDIVQLAAMAAGGVVVGLDPHDTDHRLAQMALQSGLVGVVGQDEAAIAKLGPDRRDSLRFTVTLDGQPGQGSTSFDDLERLGQAEPGQGWDQSRADDEALVVFTSGTTGEPKGIAYTHRQVCGAVAAILLAFPDIGPGSRLACWLPLSNLFQRMINFCALGRGAQTFYVADPRAVMAHVPTISPHLFIGVPRFFEKLYAGILEAIDAKPAWQRKLAHWAIRAGDRRARATRGGAPLGAVHRLSAAIADRLVLARVRSVLGRDIRFLISGSAPMPVWLLERFHGLGFLVLEAYGMSECIVPVAANTPGAFRFGTVGRPLDGVEVRLAPDGELLVRGAGVFAGYLGDSEARRRTGADGFLASGDHASIDPDGFVTLLGRKSEIFKTSTGRRIAPSTIESRLRQIPYVEHAVVFGASRPFLVALIAISEPALRSRVAARAAAADDARPWAGTLRADLASALADLPDHHRPAGAVLTTRPFTVDAGLVTPNLKVRRANVEKSFASEIDELSEAIAAHPTEPIVVERHNGTVLWLST
ncbi:MAG: AMP-binding protein [Burkholderiales bacterium]|nr:AMP-binding protein [Burkholderiales bacterium]